MLQQIDIHNFALIDKISIQMENGLNLLTGETGAGKSIIIDAINTILGERVSKDSIRTGKEKALIEAVFLINNKKLSDLLDNYGIEAEEDGTLIISREFTITGKNTCRINGKITTVSILREIGQQILDIHGQHDNQSLLRTESHIGLLDSFAGFKLLALKQKFQELLSNYKNTSLKLKELSGSPLERERRIDLLKFQINEIKKAKLKDGEEEELNKQRLILSNSEKIINSLSVSYELLFSGNNIRNSSADILNEALKEFGAIARFDDKYIDIEKRLQDVSYILEDIIEDIRKGRDEIEFDPDLLERVDERIDLIYKLKKKYGSTIVQVLEYLKSVESELEQIEKSEETVRQLNDMLISIDKELYGVAKEINLERIEAARVLETRISEELEELEMKRAKLCVNIEFDTHADGERRYNSNGLDKVEFLISPNAGEPLKPLSKIASGGEMSRIMLAIKSILADYDDIPTLIFDEIDIGVSGRAAQKVGEKLALISKSHQVLCVTHLAQIACLADEHYLIEKVSGDDKTDTYVKKLIGRERINEISRLLGGANISEITMKHAEEMLENSKKLKMVQ